MMQANDLLEKYAKRIDDEVEIVTKPNNEPFPFDQIMNPLYKHNTSIHKIQLELKTNVSPSLDFIVKSSKILSEAENAVDFMLKRRFNVPSYERVGAKVIDASNVFDQLIENRLNELEDEFVEVYKPIRKLKDKNSKENIKKAREKMDKIVGEYFQLNQIFNERGMNNNAKDIFLRYESNRDEALHLSQRIEKIENEYKVIPKLEERKSSLKHIKKEVSPGNNFGFGKGKLYKYCSNVEYYEGMIELKRFHSEIKDALNNPKKYDSSRQNIKDLISEIRKKDFESMDINELKSYDIEAFDSDMMYCEVEITKYKMIAEAANEKISKVREIKIQELQKKYEALKKRSEEIIDENSKLRKEYRAFTSKYKSTISNLDSKISENEDLKLANKVLKKQENKYNAQMRSLTDELSNLMGKINSLKEEKKLKEIKKQLDINNKYLTKQIKNKPEGFKVVDGKIVENTFGTTFEYNSFPLELHVMNLGDPKNLDYYELMDIMEGRKSKYTTWTERFNAFKNKLEKIGINSNHDVVYLKGIAEGIDKAIMSPETNMDVDAAKESYVLINNMVEAYST